MGTKLSIERRYSAAERSSANDDQVEQEKCRLLIYKENITLASYHTKFCTLKQGLHYNFRSKDDYELKFKYELLIDQDLQYFGRSKNFRISN